MQRDYTFDDVRDFLREKFGEKDPKLLKALDVLAGVGLILSPLVLGPAGAAALPLIGVKNDLIKAGRYVVAKLTKAQDEGPLENYRRMQMAYTLICQTSFCEALDEALPHVLDLLGVNRLDDLNASQELDDRIRAEAHGPTTLPMDQESGWLRQPIRFPHPTESFDDQLANVGALHARMSREFMGFLQATSQWASIGEEVQQEIREKIQTLEEESLASFRSHYVDLARQFDAFFVWAMLVEDEAMKNELRSQSQNIERQLFLAEHTLEHLDIGFKSLHQSIAELPNLLDDSRADRVIDALMKRYGKRIDDAIVKDESEPEDGRPALTFPKISEIFIPQAFKAVRKSSQIHLEREDTWAGKKAWDTLGPYLLHVLSSPWSVDQPLIILGHPGSGKSLLTEVLATRLLCPAFFPIRVPLRDVNADADIQKQIEDWIREYTGEDINWITLSARLQEINRPPLIILDGYDELLQASGKVFASYVRKVKIFQDREAEIGRPTRAIVTSRMTLIDKAEIPDGATVIRLLEFDKPKRDRWVEIWNRTNKRYFDETGVKPFTLPEKNEKILELAEQPLLLLMLGLYDSEDNPLHAQEGLDQTVLYDDLLRRFVRRERTKGEAVGEFNALNPRKQDELIDKDMERLGVAATGMFNRRTLHILHDQLNNDIRFFGLEQPIPDTPGRSLTQAEKLLGGFFFVHQSKTTAVDDTRAVRDYGSAFEFLHNTFGEFLMADFALRQILTQTKLIEESRKSETFSAMLDQQLAQANAFPPEWYACLIYTPLHSRPVILEMMRDWANHRLKTLDRSPEGLLNSLDVIVENQLSRVLTNVNPPQMLPPEKNSPFPTLPLQGHLAIYGLNLILLRTVLSDGEYVFNENRFPPHEDGTRPWDQLTYFWRSWFSLENLSRLTAIFDAQRYEDRIHIKPRTSFSTVAGGDRLFTVYEVGKTLADDITACLAGFQLWNEFTDGPEMLSGILHSATSSELNLGLSAALSERRWPEPAENPTSGYEEEEFITFAEQVIRTRGRWTLSELNTFLRLAEGVTRVGGGAPRHMGSRIRQRLSRHLPWPGILDHGHAREVAELISLIWSKFSVGNRISANILDLIIDHPRLAQFICASPGLHHVLAFLDFQKQKGQEAELFGQKITTVLFALSPEEIFRLSSRFDRQRDVFHLLRQIGSPEQQSNFLHQVTMDRSPSLLHQYWVLLELSQFEGASGTAFISLIHEILHNEIKRIQRRRDREVINHDPLPLLQLAIVYQETESAEVVIDELRKNNHMRRLFSMQLTEADPLVAATIRTLLSKRDEKQRHDFMATLSANRTGDLDL